jgi:hypothetical protein
MKHFWRKNILYEKNDYITGFNDIKVLLALGG